MESRVRRKRKNLETESEKINNRLSKLRIRKNILEHNIGNVKENIQILIDNDLEEFKKEINQLENRLEEIKIEELYIRIVLKTIE